MILLWVKYTGKITYNSIEVRGFQPGTSRSLSDDVAKHLIKKFPKLFHSSKAEVVKEEPKDVKEEPSNEEKKEEKKK